MQIFSPSSKNYRGALHYEYFSTFPKHQYPEISSNANNDTEKGIAQLIHLISSAGSTSVWTQTENETNDLIIDLVTHKLHPSHYELGTSNGGSPPIDFSFSGSNDKNEWFVIHSKTNYLDLCPYLNDEPKCQSEEINVLKLDKQIGPFQYFKFSISKTRYLLYDPDHPTKDLRLSGFDIYGKLYRISENVFKYHSCKHLVIKCSKHFIITFPFFIT